MLRHALNGSLRKRTVRQIVTPKVLGVVAEYIFQFEGREFVQFFGQSGYRDLFPPNPQRFGTFGGPRMQVDVPGFSNLHCDSDSLRRVINQQRPYAIDRPDKAIDHVMQRVKVPTLSHNRERRE